MGHSITCNFHCNINLSNGVQIKYGAMTLKEVKGMMLSEKEYQSDKGISLVNTEVLPQTKRGKSYMRGYDFLIMDNFFNLDYFNIGQPIPFYTF